MTKRATIPTLIAGATVDAYSFERYGWSGWRTLASLLLDAGLTRSEIDAVLRSKWTRWAADDQGAPYGRVSGRKAFAYLTRCNALTANELRELVAV